MKKRVYLDYATTTPLDPKVERAMRPFYTKNFGNPDSLHKEGVEAARALGEFRKSTALLLQAHEHEIIFTSGGTESNNLAIQGVIRHAQKEGKDIRSLHVVTTVIEHASVLNTLRALEHEGLQVTYVSVNKEGIIDLNSLKSALRAETILVSVMHANNEIGTIQPIRKISGIIRDFSERSEKKKSKPLFHVDACQSALYLSVDQDRLGADLISLDAHKMYGPKGVGALYVRRGTSITSLVYGGGQEKGLRSGTVALPLIAGFAQAFSRAVKQREKNVEQIKNLREYFLKKLQSSLSDVVVNGSLVERLPHNLNVSIKGLDAEFAVLKLDAAGIACSAKSACLEHERESYVVKALGRNNGSEKSSLRFTLGKNTKRPDIDRAVAALKKICQR